MSHSKIAVLLPALNEEATIGPTVRAFHVQLPDAHYVLIDNGSTDKTVHNAREEFADLQCTFSVLREPRRGKGNALRKAFTEVDADVYVVVDADDTYPADRVGDLIDPVVSEAFDMVVGDRHASGDYYRENTRPFHNVGNKLVQVIINRLFGSDLHDILSGYRALSRRFVKSYAVVVTGFEIETDMSLHALDKRLAIAEIPVAYQERPAGSTSKLRTYRDGVRVIRTLFNVFRNYKPLKFLGGVSLCLFLTGCLTSIPVFDDWITSQYIYHVPLAVLSAALMISALTILSAGLVLDGLAAQARRDFGLQQYVLAEIRHSQGLGIGTDGSRLLAMDEKDGPT